MRRSRSANCSSFGLDFWIGAGIGFATISATLAGIFAFHGFRLTGLAIHGSTIATSLAAWGATFLLVGLAEEFAFREGRSTGCADVGSVGQD